MLFQRKIEWWDSTRDKLADTAFAWVNHCSEANQVQRYESVIYVEVAHSFNVDGNTRYDQGINLRQALPYKIRENIIRSATDSVAALVGQARTSPQYTCTDADWDTARKAEKRSWVLQAQLLNLGLFPMMARAFIDACETGCGFLVGSRTPDNKPFFERVLPNEIITDPEDSRYGTPEAIGRIKFVARGELERLYPRRRDDLARSQGPSPQDYEDFWINQVTHSDRVKVVELWKKPTVEGGSDGRHIIATSNSILLDEPFTRRRIPIVRVIYATRSQGYFGQGLAERMFPSLVQICKMDSFLERCLDLTNVYAFLDDQAEVKASQVTNFPGQIVQYSSAGQPPQVVTFDTLPTNYLSYREAIKQRAFENEGISQAVATGDVQAGLTSGKAIRASDDVGSRRFVNAIRHLEDSYLYLCHVLADINDECAVVDPEYMVTSKQRAGKRTWQKRTRWADVYLEPDDVTVTMWPMSTTATLTPSAKWQTLSEWIELGFIDSSSALSQMGLPDPEQSESMSNANLDLIYHQLSQIVEADGDPNMFLPIPQQDQAMAQNFAQMAYLSAWRNGAPEDVLRRFENYLAAVKRNMEDAAAASAPPADPAAMPSEEQVIDPAAVDPNALQAA